MSSEIGSVQFNVGDRVIIEQIIHPIYEADSASPKGLLPSVNELKRPSRVWGKIHAILDKPHDGYYSVGDLHPPLISLGADGMISELSEMYVPGYHMRLQGSNEIDLSKAEVLEGEEDK